MSTEFDRGTWVYVTRGDTPTFTPELYIKNSNDEWIPFTPAAGSKIIFRLKKDPMVGEVLLEKELVDGELAFDVADTASLEFGDYRYELEYVLGAYHETFVKPVIEQGVFTIGLENENHGS